MAITLKAAPQRLTPAYNPVKYIYDSTNKNLGGFKYIFDIYASGTATKIAEYRVLPTYGTGYGEIDLSKLLQAKVSFDLDTTNDTSYAAPNSYYKYDVKVGEEYLTTTSYTSALTQYTTAPYAGRVQINVANTFVVGDQIVITQTGGGATNPNLEGLFSVLVATPTYIVVNSLWSQVVNANKDGDITYADGRRTITRDITTDVNNYVFNGALPWTEWPSWDENNYNLDSSSDRFLTSCPLREFYVTLSQDLWMNAAYGFIPTGTHKIVFENDGGEIFEKALSASDFITGNAVGPNNLGSLTPVSGPLPLIKPTTQFYTYYYEHNGSQVTDYYRVNIDRRWQDKEYSIIFLDRFGSWGSFAFTGRAYETGSVQREQYNMDVEGKIASTQWTYDLTERGYVNSYVSVENTIQLNTDWMTEDMATYFTELISSPYTYFKVSNYDENCDIPESTKYISCNIVDTNYEYYKQRNKNLIRQSITIKLANNDIVNG
jgi:hypothetical protein